MRISTQLLYQRGVNAIENQQFKLSATQEQLATGERLKSPADDPFASTRIVALDEQEKLLEQYRRNADYADARLGLEETSLTSAINALQRVRELAVQGANGSLSVSDRQAVALEVTQRMEGILQIANTRDSSGEYIFSGDRTTTPAFVHDGVGNFLYQGDQGQRYVQVGTNRSLATGDSGYDVFENVQTAAGPKNVMQIVYDMADTLNAGNPSSAAIDEVDAAIERLSGIRSVVGARVNAIDSEMSSNETFSLAIKMNRSELADLDYADAVSRFQQQLAGLQAAQQSFVQIQGLSLFNFI